MNQLPIGVGFLGWQLEKPDSPVLESLTVALAENVEAVWFAFGQKDLSQWIKIVRDHDEKMKKDKKTIIFAQICSVEEALIAINDWRVDVLVVQGKNPALEHQSYARLTLIIQGSNPVGMGQIMLFHSSHYSRWSCLSCRKMDPLSWLQGAWPTGNKLRPSSL